MKERGLEPTLEMLPDPVPVPSAEVKDPQPAKEVSEKPTETATLSTEAADVVDNSGSSKDIVGDGDSKKGDNTTPKIKDTPNHRPSVLHGLPVASPKEQVKGVGKKSGKGPGKGRGRGRGKGRGKKAKKSNDSDESGSSEDEQEEQEEEEQEEEQETEPPPKPFKRLRRCATKDIPGENGFPPMESGELPAAKVKKGKGNGDKGQKTSSKKGKKVKAVKKTIKKAKAGDANNKQKAKVSAPLKDVKTIEAASSSHENAKKRKAKASKVENKRAKVEVSKAVEKKEKEGQVDDKVIERKAQRSRKSSAYVAARKKALEEGLSEEAAKEKGRMVS